MDNIDKRAKIIAKGFGVERISNSLIIPASISSIGNIPLTVAAISASIFAYYTRPWKVGIVAVVCVWKATMINDAYLRQRRMPEPQGLFAFDHLLPWQKIGRLIVTFSALSRHMKEEDVRLSWVSSFLMRMVKVSRCMFKHWESVGKEEGLERKFFLLMINECVKMGKTIEKIACSYHLTSALFAEHLQHQAAFVLFNEFYSDPLRELGLCPVVCLPSNNQEVRKFDVSAAGLQIGDETVFLSLGKALRTFPVVKMLD